MQVACIKIGTVGDVLVIFAVIFILSGAAYFGVASCGGYAWEKQFFLYTAIAISIGALIVPCNFLDSLSRKFAYLLALLVGYIVIEAVGSTIYFGGENWHEYGRLFVHAVEFGPC
jgi:hypothetical protein